MSEWKKMTEFSAFTVRSGTNRNPSQESPDLWFKTTLYQVAVTYILYIYTDLCLYRLNNFGRNWLDAFFLLWRCDPTRVMAFSFLRFLDHIQRRNTVGRTPLDEWSARRRDLYLIHTAITTDKYPCPRWDSNPQSQQASGRRPTS